jgi:hypothetical protein
MTILFRHSTWACSTALKWAFSLLLGTVLVHSIFGEESFGLDREAPSTQPSAIVTELQRRLTSNQIQLDWHDRHGFLEGVLRLFDIPQSSQLLVFSKTSQLREHITPHSPRALYFNDDAYVAWVPGTPHIEIVATEPKVGSVFYILEQKKTETPRFELSSQCLECHTSKRNLSVPGPIVRSFPTDENGAIERNNGVSAVDHRTPFKYRWGGWYVTGTTHIPHRGNRFGSDEEDARSQATVTDLGRFLDLENYPTGSSDVAALMVLEHQVHMQNLTTRLHQDTVDAMSREGNIHSLRAAATSYLQYLLFIEEAALNAPVKGNTSFATDFQALGKKDSKGRSLRDLDLKSRLLTYPCSYFIYSKSFHQIHPAMRRHLLRRLHNILIGNDHSSEFTNLSARHRVAILEILTDTLDDLPEYWTL